MALGTAVAVDIAKLGPRFHDRWNIPLDNSYPAGGYTGLEAKLQGLTNDTREIVSLEAQGASGLTAHWDYTNDKLQLFRTDQVDDPEEEVPNATDLSAITLQLVTVSK